MLVVGCPSIIGWLNVDSCMLSRQSATPSWAEARQKEDLPGILRFSVMFLSTAA